MQNLRLRIRQPESGSLYSHNVALLEPDGTRWFSNLITACHAAWATYGHAECPTATRQAVRVVDYNDVNPYPGGSPRQYDYWTASQIYLRWAYARECSKR